MKIPPAHTGPAVSKQVGKLLRDLRKQRRLTGEQLAKRAGISQSRIAKIENGYTGSLDTNQLEQLLNILEASKLIRQQITTLVFRLTDDPDSRFIYPMADSIEDEVGFQKTVSLTRCYIVCGISAVLQTAEYRSAYLKRLGFSEAEIAIELGKTLNLQETLWDISSSFYYVMPEAALYTLPADTRIQVAQLDRLERIIGASNVHIGIIPLQAGTSVFETGTFTLFDDRMLYVFIGDRIVRSEDLETLAKFINAFDELSHLACFDAEAIPLIRKAADYFTGQW